MQVIAALWSGLKPVQVIAALWSGLKPVQVIARSVVWSGYSLGYNVVWIINKVLLWMNSGLFKKTCTELLKDFTTHFLLVTVYI